jgi:type IV secretory pathway VirB6-like protein
LLCVYAMFLIALSTIALAVLLALGPLFIALLFFEATKRFFAAWIAQLANYALITVLTVMVSALLLQVVQSYATQTAARGTAIFTVDAVNMVLIAVLVFLVLRQVMPIASALAGGASLNSYGLVSRGIDRVMRFAGRESEPTRRLTRAYAAHGMGRAIRGAGQMVRSLAVHSGGYVHDRAGAGIEALGRSWRQMRR